MRRPMRMVVGFAGVLALAAGTGLAVIASDPDRCFTPADCTVSCSCCGDACRPATLEQARQATAECAVEDHDCSQSGDPTRPAVTCSAFRCVAQ